MRIIIILLQAVLICGNILGMDKKVQSNQKNDLLAQEVMSNYQAKDCQPFIVSEINNTSTNTYHNEPIKLKKEYQLTPFQKFLLYCCMSNNEK